MHPGAAATAAAAPARTHLLLRGRHRPGGDVCPGGAVRPQRGGLLFDPPRAAGDAGVKETAQTVVSGMHHDLKLHE